MNELKITEIEITPIKAKKGLVAFASCVVNNQFYIGNIAIHSTFDKNEFRLVYPTKPVKNNRSISCVHPINKQTGDAMCQAICTEFRELFIKFYDNKQIEFL